MATAQLSVFMAIKLLRLEKVEWRYLIVKKFMIKQNY